MKTASPAEEIFAMLVEKGKAYDEFLSVTELLKNAIETEEMEEVDRFIKCREELIGEIDGLDRRISRYQHSIPLDQRSAIFQRVASMSDDLGGKLRQINSTNQVCTAIAARSCEALRNDLTVINQQRQGIQGYVDKTQRIPKFLSVRS
ncbi:MAG: flagellar protein FlgN [Deltaproteobacteria bacterium]|nr:flagellar protein FlgN [Deltaproteobacteria bacterium]